MGGTSGQEADGPEAEFRRTKSMYWRDRIESEQSNPHQLWKSLGILTGDKIRQSISSALPPFDTKRQLSNMLSSFDRVAIEEVTRSPYC